MVAASVSGCSNAKRSFAAFVAGSTEALRREVRQDARRRGLPAAVDVDDVVQTAFAKLLPVYDALATEYAAFNYAHKAALSTLHDVRRRERVRHDGWLESVYRRHQRHAVDPEEEALRGLRAADVRRAFRRLPLSQRRAVALVDLEELRQADAADVLGVSQTTLKGLVQRGRARLRQDLLEVPGLAVLLRLRRSTLAPAAVAPGVAVMAALVLTVAQAPAVPPPAPAVSIEAVTLPAGRVVRSGPVAVRSTTPARMATQAAPAAARRAVPRPEDESARPAGAGKKLPDPGAGGCIGDTCAGSAPKGDKVCVRADQDACVHQRVVGVCPAADNLDPVVTCTRDADPVVDPMPGS